MKCNPTGRHGLWRIAAIPSLPVLLVALLAGVSARAAEPDEEGSLLPQPVAPAAVEPTVVGIDEYPDPLEPFNRAIFAFNDIALRYVVIPLGHGYETVMPQPVRTGVSHVFSNLQEPLHFLNHTLSGEFGNAGRNLFRFVTNTTIGIGGLFDPARAWFDIAPSRTSFNDTFRHYGLPSGPYLVMPFMGATDIRGGVSSLTGSLLHPVRVISEQPETTYLIVFDNFQRAVPRLDAYPALRAEAEDPYVYFRNQYLQAVARDRQMEEDDAQ